MLITECQRAQPCSPEHGRTLIRAFSSNAGMIGISYHALGWATIAKTEESATTLSIQTNKLD